MGYGYYDLKYGFSYTIITWCSCKIDKKSKVFTTEKIQNDWKTQNFSTTHNTNFRQSNAPPPLQAHNLILNLTIANAAKRWDQRMAYVRAIPGHGIFLEQTRSLRRSQVRDWVAVWFAWLNYMAMWFATTAELCNYVVKIDRVKMQQSTTVKRYLKDNKVHSC